MRSATTKLAILYIVRELASVNLSLERYTSTTLLMQFHMINNSTIKFSTNSRKIASNRRGMIALSAFWLCGKIFSHENLHFPFVLCIVCIFPSNRYQNLKLRNRIRTIWTYRWLIQYIRGFRHHLLGSLELLNSSCGQNLTTFHELWIKGSTVSPQRVL